MCYRWATTGIMPQDYPTLLHAIRGQAIANARKPAIVHESLDEPSQVVRYGELWQRAISVSGQIREITQPRDRVVLLFPSTPDFVAAFLGCLLAGRTAIPSSLPRNARAVERTLAVLEDSGASLVLTNSELRLKLEAMLVGGATAAGDPTDVVAMQDSQCSSEEIEIDSMPNAVAFLQYTSGSTGNPRGVVVANGNLACNVELVAKNFGYDESSVFVNWMPPHHDMGLIGGILTPLFAGGTVVLMSPNEFVQRPARWLDLITKHGGTITGAPNFAYDACVDRIPEEHLPQLDLGSLGVAFNGSEPIRPETIRRFTEKFSACGFSADAFLPCYGLAEATVLVSGAARSDYRECTFDREALRRDRAEESSEGQGRTLVGCGPPAEGYEVAIVEPATKRRCREQEVGEVWLSGPSVCQGYWNRESDTKETFDARLMGKPSRKYLRTGDLGIVRGGQLFIVGRLKNIVIIRGLNYACEDIEDLAQKSHPAVMATTGAAFAVDGPQGEALVVLQEVNRAYQTPFDRVEVAGAIQESIVLQYGIRAHEIVLVEPGTLPRTTSGKSQRFKARKLYKAGELSRVPDRYEPATARTGTGSDR